ncbi:SRPBCC family protein [Kribbella sp. CA-253562]|uniref:SRPBCC family protein n=1 Tax=Kribbella sp. CA-253562 TaxID=3239942 RepID=UPI003D8DDC4C
MKTVPSAPARVTAAITIDRPLTDVTDWFANAENLPSWSGFFQEVDAAGNDGRHPALSLAGVISTWTEVVREPGGAEVAICSVIRGRTERAALSLRQTGAGTHVRFTVTVLRPEGATALQAQEIRMGDELDAARHLLEVWA